MSSHNTMNSDEGVNMRRVIESPHLGSGRPTPIPGRFPWATRLGGTLSDGRPYPDVL